MLSGSLHFLHNLSIRKPQAIYDIPEILSLAFPCAATPSNIMAGFKVARILPYMLTVGEKKNDSKPTGLSAELNNN